MKTVIVKIDSQIFRDYHSLNASDESKQFVNGIVTAFPDDVHVVILPYDCKVIQVDNTNE